MNTIINKQVFPCVGYVLYSDEARATLAIIARTCGVHHILVGACSSFTNEKRYGGNATTIRPRRRSRRALQMSLST
jgi:uncharacterized protein YcgI (DUF1989 family)